VTRVQPWIPPHHLKSGGGGTTPIPTRWTPHHHIFGRRSLGVFRLAAVRCSKITLRSAFAVCRRSTDSARRQCSAHGWPSSTRFFGGDDDPRKRPQRQSAATSEMILTKEQLYDMFQNILAIKKYEHQILYNAMQVRSAAPRVT